MTTVTNKNGIQFDIDALATDVNGKMDKDGVNATCPVVISRTPNEQGGIVEIWSDGYCVQTGMLSSASGTVNLSTPYVDTNYLILDCLYSSGQGLNVQGVQSIQNYSKTTNSFYLSQGINTANIAGHYWRAEGYTR